MQKTSFESATQYLDQAIDAAGYLPNIKAREQMRASVEANYSGQYLSAVLREVVNAHAHMLVKKAVEPVAQPTAQQNAEAINKHVQEVIRQLSVEFPDINFLTSAHNNKILGEFVDSQGGVITLVAMKTAVRLMYNMLEKNPPPPPPPPAPEPEPPEVLKILSDGTRQLSLNITESELKDPSLTKVQIRDWLNRRTNGEKLGGRYYNG
jgi:hypothetical protein